MKTKQTTTAAVPVNNTAFEQQVLQFCKTAAEPIVKFFKHEDDYGEQVGANMTKFLQSFSALGTKIEIVQAPDTSSSETQGEYRDTAIILKFTTTGSKEVYVKISCDLSSYGGLEYVRNKQVTPVTKTVQVFE